MHPHEDPIAHPADRRFYEHLDSQSPGQEPLLVRTYCCPCCGYPTLAEPASYEICSICRWEDDGCEGLGPNASSLAEAQENFRRYLTSHGPAHEISPQFQKPGLKFVHQWALRPSVLDFKRRLIAALDRYMVEPDLHRRGQMWKELPTE